MTLVPSLDIVRASARARRGIGAFNVVHLETAEALVSASERVNRPVILQISQNCVDFHGGLEPLATAVLSLARSARTPVAVHLDHAERIELVQEAIALGFGSVMFDGSALEDAANTERTRSVVRLAHAVGVAVEGEIGAIGGKGHPHDPGVRTSPEEAVRFVRETGVDTLAVAVGSTHAMAGRTASLDLALIVDIRAALSEDLAGVGPVPLVLHGGSGVSDSILLSAIRAGMTKINVSTHLSGFFTRTIRKRLTSDEDVIDSRKYIGPAREAVAVEAARMMTLFAVEGDPAAQ